jgi:FMN phosphatase YigB (HAD superfamily)
MSEDICKILTYATIERKFYMKISKIKAIVFDLDGTLYEDTHHFDYYAKCLKNYLPENLKDSFTQDYEAVLNNLHPLKFGRIYDSEKQLIVVQSRKTVKEVYRWDGSPLSKEEINDLYPQVVPIDMLRFISIGDMWWVPSCIARHYGATKEVNSRAFLDTREYMMTPEFTMKPVIALKDVLESLQGRKSLVLLTNSPQQDSNVILEKLGLENVFHHKIFQGKKPSSTEEHFANISKLFNIGFEETLSIGDNWVNDIATPQRLGCSTILIDTHGISESDWADVIVKNTTEVVPYLERLI